MVPKGWLAKELDEICEKVAVGLAISVTPFMRKSGVKLIRNQNIKRNYFDSSSVVFIDEDFAKSNKSKMVQRGDVVAVRTGSNIGEACVVPQEFEGALTFTTLIARPKKDVLDSFYLATHINSEIGINEVNRLCAGGGKPNLNSGELKHYRISTPPLAEQKKIAQILSTWDQGIATTERLLDLARQQKKALMQQLLTGKKRAPGFSLPWRRVELAQLIREVTKKKEENPEFIELLTVRLHNKGVIPSGKYPNPTEGGRPYYRRYKGEIIIGRQNLHNGGVAIVGAECDGLIASNAISSFEVTGQGNPTFILEFMSTEKFKVTIDNLIGGTGQKEISTKEIMKLRVSAPCVDEQSKIADVLSLANQEVSILQSELNGLKQEKKSLMQQLLTGKVRVKVMENHE